ncbi:hypothetical protein GDO81_024967 [Engystomops pustulosus]|uniref:Uncharacterized protein n=1 Tax=Engystomops pustulosus TaxID=76066 RepID=A0AAV6YQC3_ENGPU|nr:hypothetical protein GDO81_024967 [Engystomops pustulosus]
MNNPFKVERSPGREIPNPKPGSPFITCRLKAVYRKMSKNVSVIIAFYFYSPGWNPETSRLVQKKEQLIDPEGTVKR